jgi:hypothetical protein
MNRTKTRFLFYVALAALLAIFAGCKAESPTAPPSVGNGGTGGSGAPGGGVTPPSGASLTLTASTTTPQTSSFVTLTAAVTQNGQAVPNGTAVEFDSNNESAIFTDTQAVRTIRTTTNGVATATITSTSATTATVTAVVNNVTKTVTITWSDAPVTPPQTSTAPTITAVSPTTGPPAGGTVLTITGTNFRTPARVLVDAGPAGVKEAFVNQSTVTPTQLIAVTPAINLVSTQTQVASITVIVDSGNPTEARATRANAFTYITTNLTPVIRTISPTSGPTEGGTQVTIIGDAFEHPLQVFFGAAQATVISDNFSQIVVTSPAARDTSSNGGTTVTGPVEVKVLNVNSGKSVTSTIPFRYTPKMQITAINPVRGSALGGTDITIDGTGFDDPVTVDIGASGTPIRAQVIRVSGTQILARTGGLASPCNAAVANVPVTVTNVANGDSAISTAPQVFSYIPVPAVITSITGTPPVTIGSALNVGVQNPGVGLLGSASVGFTIGTFPALTTPSNITVGTGTQGFTVIVPNGLTFQTTACTTGGGVAGLQAIPTVFPIAFANVTTGCSATANVTIDPPSGACVAPPSAALTSPAQSCPTPNLTPASQTAAGTLTHTATITIANNGSLTLNLSAPAVAPTNASVTVSPNTATTVPGGNSQNFTVTVDPTAAGPDGATITFSTNDPARPTVTVVVCGNAT